MQNTQTAPYQTAPFQTTTPQTAQQQGFLPQQSQSVGQDRVFNLNRPGAEQLWQELSAKCGSSITMVDGERLYVQEPFIQLARQVSAIGAPQFLAVTVVASEGIGTVGDRIILFDRPVERVLSAQTLRGIRPFADFPWQHDQYTQSAHQPQTQQPQPQYR